MPKIEEFDWNKVVTDQQRGNYLGNSLVTSQHKSFSNPNPRALDHYLQNKSRNIQSNSISDEISDIKAKEEEMMAQLLGLPPPIRKPASLPSEESYVDQHKEKKHKDKHKKKHKDKTKSNSKHKHEEPELSSDEEIRRRRHHHHHDQENHDHAKSTSPLEVKDQPSERPSSHLNSEIEQFAKQESRHRQDSPNRKYRSHDNRDDRRDHDERPLYSQDNSYRRYDDRNYGDDRHSNYRPPYEHRDHDRPKSYRDHDVHGQSRDNIHYNRKRSRDKSNDELDEPPVEKRRYHESAD